MLSAIDNATRVGRSGSRFARLARFHAQGGAAVPDVGNPKWSSQHRRQQRDHTRLTYRNAKRDFRRTDVYGNGSEGIAG